MRERPDAPLPPAERVAWLRLIRSANIGPVTFFRLIERYGSADAAIDALPELAARGGRRRYDVFPAGAAEAEIEAGERGGYRLLALGDADYPAPLAAIEDPPPLLWVAGDPAILTRPAVAVIGARNASANGRAFARRMAGELGADAGYTIVSGLARGIDSAAHEGALATGTVAVLAGGIDVVYPPENRDLYARIAETGAVVAEMPLGLQPTARHFPVRNRLIAGLSLGVVVVEASRRSGSLITARLALDQGREVFAVPGPPSDPRAAGTNGLIRDGAALTESAADVIDGLAGPAARIPLRRQNAFDFRDLEDTTKDVAGDDAAHEAVLSVLGPAPVAVDEIVRACQMSTPAVTAVLLELELAGRLERHPGNLVSLLDVS